MRPNREDQEALKREETELEIELTLLDLNRVLDYIAQLRREWRDRLTVHLRIGGEGVSLPEGNENAYEILNRMGGPDQIDYLAASVPNSFLFSADFADGMLRLAAKNGALLSSLAESWKRTPRREVSQAILNVALTMEAKRFVLSCVDNEGGLCKFPGGQPLLEEAYVASRLGRVGMKHILRRYCEWLVSSQHKDGGWSLLDESAVVPTASAVLVLISAEIMDVAGRIRALQQAIEFLTVTEGTKWTWPSQRPTSVSSLLPAIAITTFIEHGGKPTRPIQRPISVDAADLASCNLILTDYLNDLRVINTQTFEEAYSLLHERLKHATLEAGDSTQALTSLIYLVSLREKSLEPEERESLTKLLIGHRNSNGGWPRETGERSELTPTILSLLSYGALHPQVAP